MGKNGKRRKNILKKFKDIDNETLKEFIKEEMYRYQVLQKSEQLARKILLKYGMNTYGSPNEHLDKRFSILMELAKLRKLNLEKLESNVEVTDIDIITRINEFKFMDIIWIDKHTYLFDLVDETTEEIEEIDELLDDHMLESDKKIEQINSLYESIIIKEFGIELLEQYEKITYEKYSTEDLNTLYESSISISSIPEMLIRRKTK